jgi:hypothetical protein
MVARAKLLSARRTFLCRRTNTSATP